MKKRAMKKWIPNSSCYCYSYDKRKNKYITCKWYKKLGVIKRNKLNCEFASTCNEECWTTPGSKCRDIVVKCMYLNFIDTRQETLLWDKCKECGVHNSIPNNELY